MALSNKYDKHARFNKHCSIAHVSTLKFGSMQTPSQSLWRLPALGLAMVDWFYYVTKSEINLITLHHFPPIFH